jgi:hypothetical protein
MLQKTFVVLRLISSSSLCFRQGALFASLQTAEQEQEHELLRCSKARGLW